MTCQIYLFEERAHPVQYLATEFGAQPQPFQHAVSRMPQSSSCISMPCAADLFVCTGYGGGSHVQRRVRQQSSSNLKLRAGLPRRLSETHKNCVYGGSGDSHKAEAHVCPASPGHHVKYRGASAIFFV